MVGGHYNLRNYILKVAAVENYSYIGINSLMISILKEKISKPHVIVGHHTLF